MLSHIAKSLHKHQADVVYSTYKQKNSIWSFVTFDPLFTFTYNELIKLKIQVFPNQKQQYRIQHTTCTLWFILSPMIWARNDLLNLAFTIRGLPNDDSYKHLPTTRPANSKCLSLRWEGLFGLGCT